MIQSDDDYSKLDMKPTLAEVLTKLMQETNRIQADLFAKNYHFVEAQDAALTQIQALVAETIGKDESWPMDDREWERVSYQNQLRSEQRIKAQSLDLLPKGNS